MRSTGLIPGGGFADSPFPEYAPPRRESKFLRFIVIGWLLGGLGYAGFKVFRPAKAEPVSVPVPAKPGVTAISTEDLARHLDSVNSRITASTAKIRRAQLEVSRALPGVHRDFLFVEEEHLKNATSAAEDARRELEQGREEFELVRNSIKKENDQQ